MPVWHLRKLEVTNWDLKTWAWRAALSALRLHRTGRGDAVQRAPEPARAIHANIQIVRVFVRIRRMLIRHADLTRRLDALERKDEGKQQAPPFQ